MSAKGKDLETKKKINKYGQEGYFLFDTNDNTWENFSSLSDVEIRLGKIAESEGVEEFIDMVYGGELIVVKGKLVKIKIETKITLSLLKNNVIDNIVERVPAVTEKK